MPDLDVTQLITDAAIKYGVPPQELLAIKRNETGSGSGIGEISRTGAIGPMQLMPATAKELGVDPHDPAQNIDGGARYYAQMRQRFGSPELAAAAYNGGPGVVISGKYPSETQGYVTKFKNQLLPGATGTQVSLNKPAFAPTGQLPAVASQQNQQQQQMPGTAAMGGGTGSLYPQFMQAPNPGFLRLPPLPQRQPLNLSNIQALLPSPLPSMQTLLAYNLGVNKPGPPSPAANDNYGSSFYPPYDWSLMRQQGSRRG